MPLKIYQTIDDAFADIGLPKKEDRHLGHNWFYLENPVDNHPHHQNPDAFVTYLLFDSGSSQKVPPMDAVRVIEVFSALVSNLQFHRLAKVGPPDMNSQWPYLSDHANVELFLGNSGSLVIAGQTGDEPTKEQQELLLSGKPVPSTIGHTGLGTKNILTYGNGICIYKEEKTRHGPMFNIAVTILYEHKTVDASHKPQMTPVNS